MILANDDTYGQINLIALVVLVAAAVAAAALGLVWAWQAGSGSKPALQGLICAGGLEGLWLVWAIPAANPLALISIAALGGQAALYSLARSKQGAGR